MDIREQDKSHTHANENQPSCLGDVSGSAWEKELVGKNIHSVFTWCKDCGMEGCNIPFNDECGNCGSKNTVRYYDKETIDLLF
jgi:hypothetical protein